MRYFFHIRDGARLIMDPDGEDFATLEAVRVEAVEAARELIAMNLRAGRPLDGRSFEIWDETGQIVDVLAFLDAIPRLDR